MPRLLLRRAVTVVSLTSAAVVVGSPALAKDEPTVTGCVNNADFAKLSNGQALRFVHAVAGDDAQLSVRRWTRTGHRYQERQYTMCTPRDQDHSILVTRFQHYDGHWQAIAIDTRMGPEN
jgi:hypothetical protein